MADLLGEEPLENTVDPAAEFLAREQDELAELGEDFGEETNQVDAGFGELADTGNDLFSAQTDGEALVNGFGSAEVEEPSSGLISQPIMTETTEPESVRKWRQEKAELLQKMDEEEIELMAEWKEKAKKELEEWYNRRDEQYNKTKASNRADEEAFIADMEESGTGQQDWERVTRLCEFNPKAGVKSTKDTSRMRSVLLHLKQNPPVSAESS